MGEEKPKEALVLSSDEIDFVAGLVDLLAEDETSEGDRILKILFEEQRKLLMEQRLLDIWNAWEEKRWEQVLGAIKKIPEHIDLNRLMMAKFPGNPYVRSIGWLSVAMLFKHAQDKETGAHFSIEQMKSVVQFLRRTDEGLNREPWKTMFLKMAQEYFPEHIKDMVEALSETGIYEQEYLNAVWEHAMKVLANDEDLTKELIMNKTFVQLVTYIDEKMNNGSQIHGKKLLEVSDALLAREKVYDACQAYKALKKEQNLLIGPGREEIIKISDRYQEGNTFFHLSHERMIKQVKQVIKKSWQGDYI